MITPRAAPGEDVPPSSEALVQVQGLTVHFKTHPGLLGRHPTTVRAVDGVSFDIRRGETLGLVGESGCGKSTTGRAMLQLVRPTAGSVRFSGVELTTLEGEPLRRMRRRIQLIFQDTSGSLDPRMKVGKLIAEPLRVHGLASGRQIAPRVRELLSIVGLQPSMVDRYPHEFSGGQRQRIGIARALAVEPEFVVADEPISSLDVSIQAQIVNLIERLQSELGLTFLFIAHDLAVVRHVSDRVAVMYLGRIVEFGDHHELYRRPSHPYSRALLSAVPVANPAIERQRRRILLSGDPADPAATTTGCRFRNRCWLSERLGKPEVCGTVDPPPIEVSPGHWSACHFPGAEA